MPKIKTHRGAAKRFKKTATGRFKRSSAYMNHILTKKTSKRKRHLRGTSMLDVADHATIKKLLPYA